MQTHNLIQGTPEWHEFRLNHDGASEAAIMLGLSKKTKRTELLRMKATGTAKQFSEWVQINILDYGHEVEALARPLMEDDLGEDIYPVTCSDGRPSASCDGLNAAGTIGWEHKQWNEKLAASVKAKELPDELMAQPQQCMMVTRAEKWIFTVSDGTNDNKVSMEILPDPAWFERLTAGWAQFNKERESYVHSDVKPEAVSAPIKDLPAVVYEINGLTITSNIEKDVKPAVVALIEKFKAKPETDQDFADLDAFNKKARKAVVNSEATRATFKARFVDIDAFERALVELEELLTKAAIEGEKTFKSEKDNRKGRILEDGKQKYAAHIAALQEGIAGVRLVVDAPDWSKAVHGLKTLDSYQDAINTALANGIIAADAIAKDFRAKLAWCKENAAGMSMLFPDLQQIIAKPMDDFTLLITSRIEKHKADEAARLEAERAKMQAEATAKAEREAAATLVAEEARIRAEERAKAEAEQLAAKAAEEKVFSPTFREVLTAVAPKAISEAMDALKVVDASLPEYPGDQAIIKSIQSAYGVSYGTACDWLLEVAESLKVAA